MEQENVRVSLDKTLPGQAVVVSRVLLYTIAAIVLSAVTWSALTPVDVVVYARGRLTVEGDPLRISVAEPGIAAEAPAHVGQHVVVGQLLLRLDAYRNDADQARLAADLDAANADALRYRALAASSRANRKYRVEEEELAQKSIELLNVQLALLTTGLDNTNQASIQSKQVELETAKATLSRADNALAANADETAQADQQAAASEARVHSLAEQLAGSRAAAQRLVVRAPCGGTIARIAAEHPGMAVSAIEPAVVLIPDGRRLIAMTKIPNSSMRRLRVGEHARLELDAYPRQDFGDLGGQLEQIDPDADDQGFYHAWISLDRSEVRGPGGPERLRSGLDVNAQIIVERRSILTLILDPIRRLGNSAAVSQ